MPLLRSLSVTYAIFASSIWQSARAAPAMRAFGGHFPSETKVSTFHPYFDSPGGEVVASTNADQLYSQSHLHGAPLSGVTFVTHSKLSEKENKLLVLVKDWIDKTGHVVEPLGKGNEDEWKEFATLRSEVLKKENKSIQKWFEGKGIKQPKFFDEQVPLLDFLASRVKTNKEIWWDIDQITQWRKNGYDVAAMIKTGDILEFDSRDLLSMDNATRDQKAKELIRVMNEGRWHYAAGYSPNAGAKGWKEYQTLHLFKDNKGQSMLERIKVIFPDSGIPRLRAALEQEAAAVRAQRGDPRRLGGVPPTPEYHTPPDRNKTPHRDSKDENSYPDAAIGRSPPPPPSGRAPETPGNVPVSG